jgi:hypothetical protein
MSGEGAVSVYAVGDVFPDVPDGRAPFRHLKPLLAGADVVFGNCEGVYSDRPSKAPSRKHFMGAPRERGSMLGEVPFHVMTCANNHIVDGGYEGLSDTLDLLRGQGIAVTGAGMSITEASEPAILERRRLRFGFLGFCSVYPVGYEARADRPGLAPLRVRTHYSDPDPNFWEPGIAPLVTTTPFPDDLARFREAIATARERADRVIVACHWGYSSLVEELQDYELELARDAVAQGADAVVCHHHHSLRGVEIHRSKPIFYGLGAFVHHMASLQKNVEERAALQARLGPLSSTTTEEVLPLFPFRPDARRTGVATLDFAPDGSVEAGFVPAMILADGSTEPLRPEDPRAAEVADYLARISARRGLAARFQRGERDGWMHVRVLG